MRKLPILVITIMLLLPAIHKGQVLQVTGGLNASQLVNSLIGGGIAISNTTLNCPGGGSGSFNGTGSNLGLAGGVLLTSGQIINAVGPNQSTGGGTDNLAPGDANLNTLSGGLTQDACALEFDLVANCDTIQIRYVFGSEEYLEFVGTIYNDAFGFFISGPGYSVPTNIAVVPGTVSTPVTINNINNVINSPYYINNPLGPTVEYDGFTTILTAKAWVQPCSTYHIKMVVADVADGILDSGVFLEEGGISCTSQQLNLSTSTSNAASPFAVEGCVDGLVTFTRGGNLSQPLTLNYSLGGSSTNGSDFPFLPGVLTIPANAASNSISISPFSDGMTEGPETLYFIVSNMVCNIQIYDTAMVIIQDSPHANAGPDQVSCPNGSVSLGVQPQPGIVSTWSPATGLNNPFISNPDFSSSVTGNYSLIVTNTAFGSCISSDTVIVIVSPPPTADFTADPGACNGTPVQVLYTGNASAIATYNWNFNSGVPQSGSGQGPYSILFSSNGNYMISLEVIAGSCTSATVMNPVNISNSPSITSVITHPTCFGQSSGTIDLSVSNGTAPYTYAWSGPLNYSFQQEDPSGLMAGNYTVVVSDINGCSDIYQTVVLQPPALVITGSIVNPTCQGSPNGSISTTVTGGSGPFNLLWSPTGQITSQINSLSGGTHSLTVTDAQGCTQTESFTMAIPPPFSLTGTTTANHCTSPQPNGTATVIANGGSAPYTYVWTSSPAQHTQTATQLPPGNISCTVTSADGCPAQISLTVDPGPAPPLANAGPDVSFCEGEGGDTLQSSVSNGTWPLYYTWSCNETVCGLDSVHDDDPVANPTGSTTYYLEVTDANGCHSNMDSVLVTILPKPVVSAGPDISLCGSNSPCELISAQVTAAPGPYSNIQWFPAAGLSDPHILNPCARPATTTIYSVSLSSSNGCTSEVTALDTNSTVVVSVTPTPVADAGPDHEICLGAATNLNGTGSGSGPAYSYQWSPSNGLNSTIIPNPVTNPQGTTEYILTVISNGCPSTGDTIKVEVHAQPTVDAGPDADMCFGETIPLHAIASGDPFASMYSYLWSPGNDIIGNPAQQDISVRPESSQYYYVSAQSDFGCESAMDSVRVTVKPRPLAEAGENAVICQGDSVLLSGSFSFGTGPFVPANQVQSTWTPGTSLSNPGILQPMAYPSTTTVYHFATGLNGCVTNDSVIVTVFPALNSVVKADTSIICQGSSVQLTASGGLANPNFQWSPIDGLSNSNSASPLASPDTSTTYSVRVSEGGCSELKSIYIAVIPRPEAAFIHSTPDACGGEIAFGEICALAQNWIWDFGDAGNISNDRNPKHIFPGKGTYPVRLIAIGIGGCSDTTDAIEITIDEKPVAQFHSTPEAPVEMFLPNTEVQFNSGSTGGRTWLWDFSDGFNSNLENPAHTFNSPGAYFVTLYVSNASGCTDSVSQGPFIVTTPDISIPNIFSPNGDGNNDFFLVEYSGDQPFSIEIQDRWGAKIWSGTNKLQGWNGIAENGSESAEGVYFYVAKIGGRSYTGNLTLVR